VGWWKVTWTSICSEGRNYYSRGTKFMYEILLKRIYEPVSDEDGWRILVDRLWPRGISKERAALDDWAKDLAPSTEIRKEFCHIPERMETFRVQYAMELDRSEAAAVYGGRIFQMLKERPVTLLYGAKDPDINHAVVLKAWLEDFIAQRGDS